MIDVPALRVYLGDASASQWSDGELGRTLAAEIANQDRAIKWPIGAVESSEGALSVTRLDAPDLDEALCRRVARNLALRKAPLGIAFSADGVDVTRVGSSDPEIRRLENPYRPAVFG